MLRTRRIRGGRKIRSRLIGGAGCEGVKRQCDALDVVRTAEQERMDARVLRPPILLRDLRPPLKPARVNFLQQEAVHLSPRYPVHPFSLAPLF